MPMGLHKLIHLQVFIYMIVLDLFLCVFLLTYNISKDKKSFLKKNIYRLWYIYIYKTGATYSMLSINKDNIWSIAHNQL